MTRAVLLAVLFLFSASSYAQKMVARDSVGNVLTLMQERCVASPWLKDWKTASIVYDGKVFAACWAVRGSDIVILDSAGDVYPVPVGLFQPETGV